MINKCDPKRKWYKGSPNSSADNFSINIQKKKLTSLHVQRRVTVLNKLFMKHITDLMSSGETAPKMLECGIEVTQVTLSPDFQIANVFWTHEKVNDKSWLITTEEMLQKCAFTLRHELSQLRVISHVPPIQFVKDKTYSLAKEIEERLAIADFGQDYEHPSLRLEQTIQIHPRVEIDDTTSESDVNDNKILETNDFKIVLPQMRHDVLGLDHHNIMSKIKSSLNKSKCTGKDNTISSGSTSTTMDMFLNKKQDELFAQFLKKRQIKEKQRNSLKKSKERAQNSMFTDMETFDCEEDVETSFDDNFDYYEKAYEDEMEKYNESIEKNELY
ncbi:hypothetical protein KPH14_005297 [Odynerus spinipes]|uniref:Ribosome-binding factor A, mitochondrial n=1 Tax=Odynerus spinipes TaxID=1348599 RepID=A0AAD9RBG3_9HYME|nr:hypothetical protein KPH14_005297 [Odynerus spinipes]